MSAFKYYDIGLQTYEFKLTLFNIFWQKIAFCG